MVLDGYQPTEQGKQASLQPHFTPQCHFSHTHQAVFDISRFISIFWLQMVKLYIGISLQGKINDSPMRSGKGTNAPSIYLYIELRLSHFPTFLIFDQSISSAFWLLYFDNLDTFFVLRVHIFDNLNTSFVLAASLAQLWSRQQGFFHHQNPYV